ncbi:MAG: ATP-binding cassette domain-containing protein [Synergistales bacterium]|nr:ATP-binding cassette domain-containing protein [Synergistales bacterium]
MKPAVACRDLGLAFTSRKTRTVWAYRHINLTLQPGASLALIGETGSGKTSLLRTLAGLVQPLEGWTALFGESLGEVPRRQRTALRRRCGYIPQDPYGALPPTLNVLEAVTEPLRLVRTLQDQPEARRAQAMLQRVGIPESHWRASLRGELSGGQRQRASLARALVRKPEVILADEPTSMQDASTRGDLLQVLKEEQRRGATLVTVTHDLLLACSLAGKGMVLFQGKVVETGPPQEMLTDPLHPYTRALARSVPRLGKPLAGLCSYQEASGPEQWSGCPYAPHCPQRTDQCKSDPPLREVAPGRSVACHLR